MSKSRKSPEIYINKELSKGSDVPKEAKLWVVDFCVVMLCGPVKWIQCFKGKNRFCLQHGAQMI